MSGYENVVFVLKKEECGEGANIKSAVEETAYL